MALGEAPAALTAAVEAPLAPAAALTAVAGPLVVAMDRMAALAQAVLMEVRLGLVFGAPARKVGIGGRTWIVAVSYCRWISWITVSQYCHDGTVITRAWATMKLLHSPIIVT